MRVLLMKLGSALQADILTSARQAHPRRVHTRRAVNTCTNRLSVREQAACSAGVTEQGATEERHQIRRRSPRMSTQAANNETTAVTDIA